MPKKRYGKADMASYVASITDLNMKDSKWLVEKVFAKLREEILNGGVYITGIGSLDPVEIPEREHMTFGEMRKVPAKSVIRYSPNRALQREAKECS